MDGPGLPVPLIVVSFLLLFQAAVALRAGRVSVAGICLGAVAYATLMMVRWYRARAAAKGAAGTHRERALLALVYPEQASRIGELLAAVDPMRQSIIVLAIELASASASNLGTTLVNAEKLLQGGDAHLLAALARVSVGAGKAVALTRAAGPDPALAALNVAARLGVSRLVVLADDDTSVEEQRRRCTLAWERLPLPRQALLVHMVVGGASTPVVLQLSPAKAPAA